MQSFFSVFSPLDNIIENLRDIHEHSLLLRLKTNKYPWNFKQDTRETAHLFHSFTVYFLHSIKCSRGGEETPLSLSGGQVRMLGRLELILSNNWLAGQFLEFRSGRRSLTTYNCRVPQSRCIMILFSFTCCCRTLHLLSTAPFWILRMAGMKMTLSKAAAAKGYGTKTKATSGLCNDNNLGSGDFTYPREF